MIATLLMSLSVSLVIQDAKTPMTAEAALRTFVAAMLAGDEVTLRAVTLPNDDFVWLLKGKPLPKDQSDQIKEHVEKMPIRALKAGDTYTLPGNRKLTVSADEVGDDRAVLLPQGAPMPTRCRKVDGVWRVDAEPIIAGRNAAEKARKAEDSTTRKIQR